MMGRVFGRVNNNEELAVVISTLSDKVERQSDDINTIQNFVESQRKYIEAMEARLAKRFEEGINMVMNILKEEMTKIGELTRPAEVVRAIESKTDVERKVRQLDDIRTNLEKAMATYLVNDLPLIRDVRLYKNPELTPQGLAVYKAVMDYIVSLAKATGKNKEYYTNRGRYEEFFKQFNIKPYDRITVRKADGTNMNTLLAAIIVNGHVRQYINYILNVLENEKRVVLAGAE